MIVVDTNVVSELMRPVPAPNVAAWAGEHRRQPLHTTSITLAEVLFGIRCLPDGRRRSRLDADARRVFATFAGHVLAFDAAAAVAYADLAAEGRLRGAPIQGADAQIAAICRNHGATLVTRNVGDFAGTGIELIDPWSDRRS